MFKDTKKNDLSNNEHQYKRTGSERVIPTERHNAGFHLAGLK